MFTLLGNSLTGRVSRNGRLLILVPSRASRRGKATKVPDAPKVASISARVAPRSLQNIMAPSFDPKTRKKSPLEVLKLDSNEGTMPAPPQAVTDALVSCIRGESMPPLIWSAEPGAGSLVLAICRFCSLKGTNVLVTSDSDDAVRLVCETFLQKGDKLLTPEYSNPDVDSLVCAVEGELVKMEMPEPFVSDEEALRAQIDLHRPKIVYLMTPNDPTGTEWTTDVIGRVCHDYQECVFIIDETYGEFGKYNAAPLLKDSKNLVITRTFSKYWGLAALRCGYLLAHPEMVSELKKLYNFHSVNQLAQVAAIAALDNKEFYEAHAKEVCEARDELVESLRKAGVKARAGAGNFALVQVQDDIRVKTVLDMLSKKHGVYFKDISDRLPGYLRITVGTKQQMEVAKVAYLEMHEHIEWEIEHREERKNWENAKKPWMGAITF